MIKKGISLKKCNKKKQVIYRILIGSHVAEFLRIAKIGHHLVSFHVSSGSDSALQENSLVKDHSKICREFSVVKKLTLKGSVSQGSLIKKVLNRVAKHCAAMALIAGTSRENNLGSWISFARCCAHELPATTAILVIYKEKLLSNKQSVLQLKGFRLNSGPEFCDDEESTSLGYAEEQASENTKSHEILDSEVVSRHGTEDLNDHNVNVDHGYREKVSLTSTSFILKELPDLILGWPLFRRTSLPSHEVFSRPRDRNMSVVEWVMSLPSRSTSAVYKNNTSNLDWNQTKISLDRETDNSSLEDHEIEENILCVLSVEDESIDGSRNSKDDTYCPVPGHKTEVSSSSVSLRDTNLSQSKPGWPLLRISAPVILDSSRESEDRTSLNRSTPATPQSQTSSVFNKIENSVKGEINHSRDRCVENRRTTSMKLPNESQLFSKLASSDCIQFSYAELMIATCQFSSDNLIGEGGCSNVFKGCLASGKPVAVKVLKSYKEAWNDFSLEVDIISSLKHQNITPLIGVCIEDKNLILVYDFLPKGSLEESLHGNAKKSVLPWEVRFKVAVATAEALNYLHKGCLRPVIHRDVKSSNILLSNEFQPQLSDFGLAVWGPTDSTYIIDEDVVGTFGYIAPEYFMHGRISDKVDVYSFGVVLLELLSGRRPIGSKKMKGEGSLVKWAKPILENGDVEALVDPNLDDFDIAQMQRMVLAANLCINQSARLRPTVRKILELFRGEKDAKEWVKSHFDDIKEDDELLEFGGKPHVNFSYLVTDDDASPSRVDTSSLSLSSIKEKQRFKLKDYLKEPQD